MLEFGWPLLTHAADFSHATPVHRPPRLEPDYCGTTIPPNLAPLNFVLEEPGTRFHVRIHSTKGNPLELSSRTPSVAIPVKPWNALLRMNAGEPLYFDVFAKDQQERWVRFDTVTNTIAREEIDGYLVYRLLKPLYNIYVDVGIYQRNLQNYEEKEVLHNRSFGQGCLNCHTFLNQSPDNMAINIRSKSSGNPMLLIRSNAVAKVDRTAGYLSWHPSGRLLAFSANKLSLFFHTNAEETRDVFDAESNLNIYRVDSNTVVTPPPIAATNYLETWPSWSPDGRHLYFCRAPIGRRQRFSQVRYDLVRVPYDLDRDTWGEPETVISARETLLSAAQPRVSPDGRFLLFCLSKYGNFPIYQPNSDLYVMDLRTRQYRRLDINSDKSDSWHSWSSNSRWIVFSSKRRDGLFARPHISYVDEQGTFHKPLLLPQKNPAFYDSFIKTFNVPELIREPIQVKPSELARAVVAPRTVLRPTQETYREHPERQSGVAVDALKR
ncbi:MAG: PD40 domain-containing protein [Verrucomicrobia bacterium]|nr:PD40 domain-containing protein [Verrucomicrobiota bacterium]